MFEKVIAEVNRKKAGLYFMAEHFGEKMESEAKSNASWIDRTGATRGAIHGGAEKTKDGAIVYLAHGSKVGLYHEEGTGIYGPKGRPIRPVNAKALAFMMGGQLILAKQVKGMKARPIVKPTAEKNVPKLIREIERYMLS